MDRSRLGRSMQMLMSGTRLEGRFGWNRTRLKVSCVYKSLSRTLILVSGVQAHVLLIGRLALSISSRRLKRPQVILYGNIYFLETRFFANAFLYVPI
jgi:hypothetical protein